MTGVPGKNLGLFLLNKVGESLEVSDMILDPRCHLFLGLKVLDIKADRRPC